MIKLINEAGQEIGVMPDTVDAVEETGNELVSVLVIGPIRIGIRMAAEALFRMLVEAVGGRMGKGVKVKKQGHRHITFCPSQNVGGFDGETGLAAGPEDTADDDDLNPSQLSDPGDPENLG